MATKEKINMENEQPKNKVVIEVTAKGVYLESPVWVDPRLMAEIYRGISPFLAPLKEQLSKGDDES